MREEILNKKLERAKSQIAQLERMIEDKTREAFFASDQLSRTVQSLNKLYQAMPSAMLVVNAEGEIERCNKAASKLLGYSEEKILGLKAGVVCEEMERIPKLQLDIGEKYHTEQEWKTANGDILPVLVSGSVLDDTNVFDCSYVFLASDLRERKQMELELRHSQKMESIGQLAAGIAHEINTPMQYIGDNAYFMQDSIQDLLSLISHYQQVLISNDIDEEKRESIALAEEQADLEYLKERTPKAAERTLHGIDRVTKIISAMKAFSHPSNEKTPTDINATIETTLTVAKSEYKYVANLITHFGDIPQVVCNASDLNQVLLNLIVNASHAIADKHRDSMGTIEITTRKVNQEVVIEIKDNGTGIPKHAQTRVFEPFYTTKEVGRGTGQGLAMAYVVVVEKHNGKIYFQTQANIGTTFFIHLPIEQ